MRHSRFTSILIAALLLEGGVASAAALKAASGCAQPPTVSTGHVFYIDPVHGSSSGDGSLNHPWNSLQSITSTSTHYPQNAWQPAGCNNNGGCANGPLLSDVAYSHYDPAQKKTATSVNPNAPIKPGDVVMLKSGNYGSLSINNLVNPSFITIAAAPGATPVFSSLQITGSQKWIVQGLTFRALASAYSPFIGISGSASKPARDVIIDSNDMASADVVDSWQPADWVAKARYRAILVDGGDANSSNVKCITLTRNVMKNVRLGIVMMANNMLVDSNTINNFGDDGIDYSGSNLVISNNTITNNLNIGDGNHNDAMQGQIGRGVTGTTFNNIMINGNVVMAQTPHATPLAFPGDLQGIDAFDMDWSNVTVINNVVITNLYHGIAFYSLHGGLIANNTVLASSNKSTWIGVFDSSHQGTSSNNVIVRNNITTVLDMEAAAPTLTADHNLAGQQIVWTLHGTKQWISKPGAYANQNVIDPNRLPPDFKTFIPAKFAYDVHLVPGTLAVGTGNLQLAPPTSTGVARVAPVDLGAYVLAR